MVFQGFGRRERDKYTRKKNRVKGSSRNFAPGTLGTARTPRRRTPDQRLHTLAAHTRPCRKTFPVPPEKQPKPPGRMNLGAS